MSKTPRGFSDDSVSGWEKMTPMIGKTTAAAPRCYTTHKPMPLGGGRFICGGSGFTPIVTDADVYVALDGGVKNTSYPWEKVTSLVYPIDDSHAPKHANSFVAMIDWLAAQIDQGRKVHVGCIGGHGRTGMVLAALAKVMMGEDDAIAYVRQHYCKKAVETKEQVVFLGKHFGIKTAAALKTSYAPYVGTTSTKSYSTSPPQGLLDTWDQSLGVKASAKTAATFKKPEGVRYGAYHPIASKTCLWGPDAITK